MVAKVKAGELTWQDYAMECADDACFPAAVTLMTHLAAAGSRNAVLTNRSSMAWGLTVQWFNRHAVPAHRLIMRPEADALACLVAEEAYLWKAAEIKSIQAEPGAEVVMCFEDWPECAEVIRRETGVPVMVVNPCYPEDPDSSRSSLSNVAGR